MTLPKIHPEGTPQEQLIRDYDDAACALKAFVDAWTSIEFNPRDYRGATWHSAVYERYKHTQALDELCDYLTEIRTQLKQPQQPQP